ncbi:MAG TPA: cytochrome C [Xanthobacteraceae bacterium]|nr:cytochrome C [Xanthobacteraceae bacterium]
MRSLLWLVAFAMLPTGALAAGPDWAYPVIPQGLPKPDASKVIKVPGSDKEYNEVSVNDPFAPPDWFPGDHAPLPSVVANGVKPDVRACALCHLTTGDGHPESANIAGLNAAYIMRSLRDFATGKRKGARTGAMVPIAKAISPDDARAAAEYFSARKQGDGYIKVVEQAEVPKTEVGEGAMRFVAKSGGTEPIGNRIIVVPQDEALARARDPRSGFIAYVPPGSIAKGEALANSGGGGKTVPCAICHGEGLHGLNEIPSIAGREPMYLARQLMDIKSGARTGTWTVLMNQVVAKLDDTDIVDLAAYVASRQP